MKLTVEQIVSRAARRIYDDLANRRGIKEYVGSGVPIAVAREQREAWKRIIADAITQAVANDRTDRQFAGQRIHAPAPPSPNPP